MPQNFSLKKKTPDYTGISTNFIKQTICSYINHIFHIFNLSFLIGVVPLQFKIAKVMPVPGTNF